MSRLFAVRSACYSVGSCPSRLCLSHPSRMPLSSRDRRVVARRPQRRGAKPRRQRALHAAQCPADPDRRPPWAFGAPVLIHKRLTTNPWVRGQRVAAAAGPRRWMASVSLDFTANNRGGHNGSMLLADFRCRGDQGGGAGRRGADGTLGVIGRYGQAGRIVSCPVLLDVQTGTSVGLAVDLTTDTGRRRSSHDSRKTADVVLENYFPGCGRAARDRLREHPPRSGRMSVYCRLSAFGATGPMRRNLPGLDSQLPGPTPGPQSITGEEGRPTGAHRAPSTIDNPGRSARDDRDPAGPAAIATRTGEGQFVDKHPLYDAAIQFSLSPWIADYIHGHGPRPRQVLVRTFRCSSPSRKLQRELTEISSWQCHRDRCGSAFCTMIQRPRG